MARTLEESYTEGAKLRGERAIASVRRHTACDGVLVMEPLRGPRPAGCHRGSSPRQCHPITFVPVIPVSQTAAQILFWSAAAVAVFAQAMVLRAAFAGRTPAASPATSARMRELLWIVLPAIALVVLLWFTWKAVPRSASVELSPTAMRRVARAHESFAGGV